MFLVFAERIHCQYLTHHGRVTPYVGINPNTPFTRGMRPFWLHCATTKLVRSPLKAERRQNGCLGRSMPGGTQDVQTSPWTPWSPWSFEHIQNSRQGGRSLTGRSKDAGGRHTHRRGGRMDAQWSAIGRPRKKYVLLWTLCINLSNASAFLVPPLCLLWPTNSVHWAITVATTVPPFGDHGKPSATLAMVLPPLCLHPATCCATTAALVVQGRHKGRAAAVTQKQNFLGLGDRWASWPFFWSLKGGTKVAALCKRGLTTTVNIITCCLMTPGHYQNQIL